jgi:hypothetical protein
MWDDSGWCADAGMTGAFGTAPPAPAFDGQPGGDDDTDLAGVVVIAAGAAALFAAFKTYVDRTVRRRTVDLNQTADRLRQQVIQGREAEQQACRLREQLVAAQAAHVTAAEERAELVSQLIALRDVATSDGPRRRIDRALERVHVGLVGAMGATFDPDHHVAVGSVPASAGHPADQVVEVVRAGFIDRDGILLRPAEVIVTRSVAP